MKITLRSTHLATLKTPMLAVPVFGSSWRDPILAALDQKLDGKLRKLAREESFKGEAGQTLTLTGPQGISATRLVLCGVGKREKKHGAGQIRTFAAQAGNMARTKGLKRFALAVPQRSRAAAERAVRWLTEGALGGVYRFDGHKTGDRKPEPEPVECLLALPHEGAGLKSSEPLRRAAARGEATARGVALARDLVNEPANVINPETLAQRALAVAEAEAVTCTILEHDELRQRGMGLIDAVGRGSDTPPRLIHLHYRPLSGEPKGTAALVGKGVTFDAGGLSIKTAKGMIEMKCDMAGAAMVIGALAAAAELELPYELHGLVPTVENMPGGKAYRPGDVFTSLSGKTVEIINTDAEGRLILADALTYAESLEPDVIFDHATLTGACMVALGSMRAGVFTADETWGDRYLEAAESMGEAVWRLPLAEELRESLKSEVADLKNMGGSWGGAITAGLFLSEFVEKTPWVHVDIAGPAFLEKPHLFHPQGGTGFGVLTLLDLFS